MDVEAGQGGGAGGTTVTLPWAAGSAGDVGYIVSVPGEDGGEELVFAVPELQHRHQHSSRFGGGGLLGLEACCGGGSICCGGAADSGDEGGGMDDDPGDEMDDYNCLGGGILNAILPEMPSEMPSDIRSVRVTTDVVVEKEGKEPTLAVHVIVDKRVPVLGWVLMVSALFGLAAMAPMGGLLSQMSPDTAPAVYPVWRYSCSSILYAPWFLLMVAGSKSARAELRDWSVMLPIVIAGVGLAGWGLCFYTALNFVDASMVALLASLTPMCLIVWRTVTGKAVHRLEIIGVLLALAGGVVSTIGEGGGDGGADTGASDTAAKAVAVAGADIVPDSVGTGEQAFGMALALLCACWGGVYIINAKAVRNKVEVSHFAFVASVVPAIVCATVLVAGFAGSGSGREMLFGPAGLLGWTQTPGLALTQVLTSLLGDVIGNFGFYLLLKYISPLVVSLASLTVPLLALLEGLMLGVVSPPGILFGVGAALILGGAGTASLVTMLPHTEVFDATKAVKLANDTEGISVVDRSPAIGGQRRNSGSERYGAVSWRSSSSGGKAGGAVDEMLPWEQNGVGPGGADGENRPLIGDDGLPATAEDKKSPGSYGSWMPRLFK